MKTVVERRLELLKLEGIGYSKNEIVKELSDNFQCSPRNVYYDFDTREAWQPVLQQYKDLLNIAANRYEQIYRKASFKQLHSKDDKIQLGSLKIMLDAMKGLINLKIIREMRMDIEELERK